MKSPFPGMNPYLEGHLWPDVHQALAYETRAMLAPQITPKYVTRLNLYAVIDTNPEDDLGIFYPDVEVSKRKVQEPEAAYADTLTPVTTSVSTSPEFEVKIPVVEIRERNGDQLITVIEILSPVNKRPPGLKPYRKKRRQLHQSGIHLLEIDLLRRGSRALLSEHLPQSHYMVTLTRGNKNKTDIWAFGIKDQLPVVPVPLKTPDKDVVLNLQKAMATIFERALYQLSLNYEKEPPPPEFSKEKQQWMQKQIQQFDTNKTE